MWKLGLSGHTGRRDGSGIGTSPLSPHPSAAASHVTRERAVDTGQAFHSPA